MIDEDKKMDNNEKINEKIKSNIEKSAVLKESEVKLSMKDEYLFDYVRLDTANTTFLIQDEQIVKVNDEEEKNDKEIKANRNKYNETSLFQEEKFYVENDKDKYKREIKIMPKVKTNKNTIGTLTIVTKNTELDINNLKNYYTKMSFSGKEIDEMVYKDLNEDRLHHRCKICNKIGFKEAIDLKRHRTFEHLLKEVSRHSISKYVMST